MQIFVRDASTVAVDVPAGATVHELKELWSFKAFGVVSTESWVRAPRDMDAAVDGVPLRGLCVLGRSAPGLARCA